MAPWLGHELKLCGRGNEFCCIPAPGFFAIGEGGMWELEDWKDFSKMLENFAEAGLSLLGAFILAEWLASRKK